MNETLVTPNPAGRYRMIHNICIILWSPWTVRLILWPSRGAMVHETCDLSYYHHVWKVKWLWIHLYRVLDLFKLVSPDICIKWAYRYIPCLCWARSWDEFEAISHCQMTTANSPIHENTWLYHRTLDNRQVYKHRFDKCLKEIYKNTGCHFVSFVLEHACLFSLGGNYIELITV